jgi:hypothetical protein
MVPEDWTKKRSGKYNCGGHQGDTVNTMGTSRLEVDEEGETRLHNQHREMGYTHGKFLLPAPKRGSSRWQPE